MAGLAGAFSHARGAEAGLDFRMAHNIRRESIETCATDPVWRSGALFVA
jgi:hypothetical protein